METIEFQGKLYTGTGGFIRVHNSKPGEYTRYYGQIVFHTENGFVAAYVDDLNNYWEI